MLVLLLFGFIFVQKIFATTTLQQPRYYTHTHTLLVLLLLLLLLLIIIIIIIIIIMKKDNQIPDTPTTQNTDVDEGTSPNTTREKLKSSNSSSDFSSNGNENENENENEISERNTSKKRRSSFGLTGLLQMHFPELEAKEEDKRTSAAQSSKKWRRSRSSRKFSFASPEEYMQYASQRNLVNPNEKENERKGPEKKEPEIVEQIQELKQTAPKTNAPEKKDRRDRASKEPTRKTAKTSKNPSWTRNWKKYQSGRKFSFASPEEYLEYSSELKKQASELSSELKRAKKRNTNSTEFECLDATADISLFRDSSDANANDHDNDDMHSVDLEANNQQQDEKKSCFKRKLNLREVVQILGLWVLIAVIALVIARERPGENQGQSLTDTGTNSTCSLCPSASRVFRPELEITLSEGFACASIDILTPSSVYTCADIVEILKGSNSECSKDDGCPALKQVASKCCVSFDVDETVEKQLIQTESSVEHLYYANGN